MTSDRTQRKVTTGLTGSHVIFPCHLLTPGRGLGVGMRLRHRVWTQRSWELQPCCFLRCLTLSRGPERQKDIEFESTDLFSVGPGVSQWTLGLERKGPIPFYWVQGAPHSYSKRQRQCAGIFKFIWLCPSPCWVVEEGEGEEEEGESISFHQ